MGTFHVVENGYLVSVGNAPDGLEPEGALPGYPPDFYDIAPPHAGARWHAGERCWHDCRTEKEKGDHDKFNVQVQRHAAYPSIGDQLDALWKLVAAMDVSDPYARDMLKKITAVKESIPKQP